MAAAGGTTLDDAIILHWNDVRSKSSAVPIERASSMRLTTPNKFVRVVKLEMRSLRSRWRLLQVLSTSRCDEPAAAAAAPDRTRGGSVTTRAVYRGQIFPNVRQI